MLHNMNKQVSRLTWTLPLVVAASLSGQAIYAQQAPTGAPSADGMGPGGMPPGGMPSDGMGPGGPGGMDGLAAGAGGMMMPSVHSNAAIYIKDGARVTANEYAKNEATVAIAKGAQGVSSKQADGVLITATDYNATGVVVEDSAYEIGGAKDYYTVYTDLSKDYVGTSLKSGPNKLGEFNSVLLFTLDKQIAKDAKTGSSGVDAGGKAVVNIDNTYMQVDGAQRYVDSTYGTSKTIVNDSYFVSTGNADKMTNEIAGSFSNEKLYISGVARNNFSVNASDTYYFNSTVITEGWAALSTDASQGDGLDLYAYNTLAKALNGGYGTYADFGCRVWLYGSTLESAEIGAIISKSGRVTVLDGASADASITQYNKGASTKQGSVLSGGRNALMIHAPDMMGGGIKDVDYGYFTAKNSTLSTTRKFVSTFDYATYGEEAKKYVDFISGDIILVKSTSANIELDNDKMDSYDGVLVHTVLNSDSMSNFLAAGDNQRTNADGSFIVKPISLSMSNMSAKGDLLHDDYQRNMEIKLSAVSLEGKIRQGTYKTWGAMWKNKGVTKAQWLPNGDTWAGTNTLKVSLDAKTQWTVTEVSNMSSLTIATGAKVSAPKGYQLTMTVNGKTTAIAPGSYAGDIVIEPKKM